MKTHVCQVMVVICYQCFAPISFVVAMLDDIPSLPSPSVPTYVCTFCTQLFCYLNEDILISKIYHNIRWLICYISSYFRSKNKYCRDIVITVKHRKNIIFLYGAWSGDIITCFIWWYTSQSVAPTPVKRGHHCIIYYTHLYGEIHKSTILCP